MARLALCLFFLNVGFAHAQGMSDDAIYDHISQKMESAYRESIASYDDALQRTPGDVRLAAERCATISAYAYSELLEIDAAYEDLETCASDLRAQFPGHPEAEIAFLESEYGEEATENLRSLLRFSDGAYNRSQRARLLLILSERLLYETDSSESDRLCAEALALDHSLPCRLRAAEYYNREGQSEVAIQILTSPLDTDKSTYNVVAKVQKLLSIGQAEHALRLFETVEFDELSDYTRIDLAEDLAAAGIGNQAQSLLGDISEDYWSPSDVHRIKYKVAMLAGDYTGAKTYYDEMRQADFWSDAFSRTRFELLRRAPGLGWSLPDVFGVLLLLLGFATIAVIASLPALAVHYRGLVRRARGTLPGLKSSAWTLRDAAFAFVAMVIGGLLAIYVFEYDYLSSLLFDAYLDDEVVAGVDSPFLMFASIAIYAGLMLPLLIYRRRYIELGSRNWSIGKCIGVGAGLAIILRIVAIIPGALAQRFPEIGDILTTQDTIIAMYDVYGVWVTLAVVALVVPIIEEVFFRGAMLHGYARHVSFVGANLTQAALFAALHESLIAFPFFVLFAYVAGEVARRAGGLLPAIILHTVFNGSAIALLSLISVAG